MYLYACVRRLIFKIDLKSIFARVHSYFDLRENFKEGYDDAKDKLKDGIVRPIMMTAQSLSFSLLMTNFAHSVNPSIKGALPAAIFAALAPQAFKYGFMDTRPQMLGMAAIVAGSDIVNRYVFQKTGLGIPPEQFPHILTMIAGGAIAFAPTIAQIGGMLKRGVDESREFLVQNFAPQ